MKKCEEIKRLISEILSGELPEEIRLHIETCEECKKEWMDWMELKKLFLKSLPQKEISIRPESILLRAKSEEYKRKKTLRVWMYYLYG
jgi:Zn-finger nucleic acid-binding protein